MKNILLFSLCLFFSMTVSGQNYWLGNNSNWNDSSNWSAGIPATSSYIVIPGGKSYYPVLAQNVHVHRCDMSSGSILSLANFEFKSDTCLFFESTINSSSGKLVTDFAQWGRNHFNGSLTVEVNRGLLSGNTFHDQLTLSAEVPFAYALYISLYRPDTFKGETTFINKGTQYGITVGVQADGGFDTTVFEQKFTFRNDFATGSANSSFGNGEYSPPGKVLFKGEVVLEGTHSGMNQPVISFINAEFRQPVAVKMTGGTVRFGVPNLSARAVVFKDDLVLDTPGTRIEFGDNETMATMNSPGMISVPSGKMNQGKLVFHRFRSLTASAQQLLLGGSGTDSSIGSSIQTNDSTYFSGPVYLRADQVEMNGGRFAGHTTVEQTGAASLATAQSFTTGTVSNTGGNQFLDSLIVINRRNVYWDWYNDTYAKGVKLVHAALGWGEIRFGKTPGMNLPELTLSSSTNAYQFGGVKIGKGVQPDSVILPAGKHINTQNFSRGDVGLFNLVQRGDTTTHSFTLTDSSSLYIEGSIFRGRFAATTPVLGLMSSVFKQFSSFTKTGNLPYSFVDDVTFYDSVSFQHLGASGDFLFGPRDSQLLKTGGSGTDSLLRFMPIVPSQISIDRNPDRILLKSNFEILPNGRYSAIISTGASSSTAGGNLLPQVTPKSPSVAGMERYGNYPVSMYTGLPTIEIPLYTIQVGSMTVPVKLTYHASGIKVTDQSGWVGLGWSLQAGGSVSRSVVGKRDEQSDGWMTTTFDAGLDAITDCGDRLDKAKNFYYGAKDSGADLFSFQSPSAGGKFVFENGSTTATKLVPTQKIPIQYSLGTGKFNLTDEQGIVHEFAEREGNDTWHLSVLKGHNQQERIEFNYFSAGTSTVGTAISDNYTIYDAPVNYPYSLPAPSQSSSIGGEVISPKHLSSIVFPSGKITFETNPGLIINDQSAAKALSKIKIWGYDVTGNYVLIRSIELVQDYFTRSSGAEKDLKLQEVKMLDAGDNLVGKYTLDYNTTHALPSRQSRARDAWDYYNNVNNTTLISPVTIDYNPSGISSSSLTIGTADRSVNEEYAQTWVLNKITFPTGGYTGFEYESNRYLDGTVKKAGGLRIKQISSGTAVGQTAFVKQYRYGTGESGYGTLNTSLGGNWYRTDQIIKGTTVGPAPDNNCISYQYRIRNISSTSAYPLTPSDGSPVTYPEVTEVELNGSDANGKTIYTYEDSFGDGYVGLTGTAKNFVKSFQFKRGQLLEKKIYNAANTLLYKQVNTYQNLLNTEIAYIGILTHEPIISSYACGGFSSMCGPYLTGQYTYKYYEFPYGTKKLTNSQEFFYHNGNETDFQKKEISTLYDTGHYQPIEMQTRASGNEVMVEKRRYAQDYSYGSFGSAGESKGWKLLVDQNRYVPVETVMLRKSSPSDTDPLVIGGQLTAYRENSGYPMPSRVLTLETGTAGYLRQSGFSFAGLSGSNIVPNTNYRLRVNVVSYDSDNNITSVSGSDGITRGYVWNTLTPSGTLRFSVPTQEHFGSTTSLDQTTGFGYSIPLLGISQRTDPSGRITTFEYDVYGRLARSKDHDGKIIEQYSYQYATSGGNNFIRTEMPRVAMTSVSGNHTQVQRRRDYFDGLGRPLQTLTELGTPDAGADLLTATLTYDAHGRDKLTYLPAPSNQSNGSYSTAHGTQAQAFYGDTYPYSEIVYEASPLSKITQRFGAGQAWRTPTPKPVSTGYANVSGIVRFKVSSTGTGIDKTVYADTDITTRTLTNEQGNQVIEYSDLEGRIVRKDVQESTGNFLTTAYCYDDFGRLAYVIQPELFVWFQTHSSLSESASEYRQWAFGYKYDLRSRLVEKKVPGADPELTVYDIWDRPVWQRNAMQAQVVPAKWTFFKYDALNRLVLSGEKDESRSRPTLQNETDLQSVHHEERNTTSPVYYTFTGAYPTVNESDLMNVTYFDNYADWPAAGIGFVQGSGYGVNFGNAVGLTTGARTRNTENGNWLTLAQYYDHRTRVVQTVGQNLFGHVERSETAYSFIGDIIKTRQTLKDQSGTTTTQLTESDYDHVSRKTAAYQTINTGSREKLATYSYDAIGRLQKKKIMPDGTYSAGGTPATIIRSADPPNNTSDIASQYVLLQPTTSITATGSNTYLAQIGTGGGTTSISGLQTIDYRYHIRGGLLGINLDGSLNPTPNGIEGDLFSYKLDYETTGRYDGNIGKQSWKNAQDNQLRSYTFTYDQSARLKSATYAGTGSENYSLPAINYDRNGNITGLQRNGKVGSSFGSMDALSYTYSGNRLMRVEDAVSGDHDVDFVNRNSGSDDYDYWNDGSLKKDLNKDITQINYQTFLGLPKEVQLTGGRWIKMYYDGSGKLLKREFSTGEVWGYTMGLIVKNGQPYQLAGPEGRVVYTTGTGTWKNEFYHTDHLGNARVSFGANGSALETKDITHFDPTGIVLNGLGQENPTENRFKYQGKESLALFGLNGIADFGARYLDKTIGGRFWSVDPLADVVPGMTPYRYAFNNPINVTDPTGMLEDDDKKTDFEYTDGYGRYSSRGVTSSINFNGAYNAVGGDGDKEKKKNAVAPVIPNLPTPVINKPNPPKFNPTPLGVFAFLASILQGDDSPTAPSPVQSENQEKGEYIYREMAFNSTGWIKSPLTGAPNARQMGARTPESSTNPDIITYDGMVLGGAIDPRTGRPQGLSASYPPSWRYDKGTIQGRVSIATIRAMGLGVINDRPTHYSIYPLKTMPFSVYQTQLNLIPWIPMPIPR